MGQIATFDLPAPPSVNHYYGKTRAGKVFILPKGRLYRQAVVAAIKPLGIVFTGKMDVWVLYSGVKDLGNLDKCLMDALQHAGLFRDDNDVDGLHFVRAGRTGETVSVEVRDM